MEDILLNAHCIYTMVLKELWDGLQSKSILSEVRAQKVRKIAQLYFERASFANKTQA